MTDLSRADDELRLHLLVLRCQVGDERAFATRFEEFGDRTHRYLRALLGDDADDAEQEAWIRPEHCRGPAELQGNYIARQTVRRGPGSDQIVGSSCKGVNESLRAGANNR